MTSSNFVKKFLSGHGNTEHACNGENEAHVAKVCCGIREPDNSATNDQVHHVED